MKCYEIIIKPVSAFGTPLKGDTLFGQFCWQAVYDPNILNDGIKKWIIRYSTEPFVVFSSAIPKVYHEKKYYYVLKKPDIPHSLLSSSKHVNRNEKITQKKEWKKRKWFLMSEDLIADWDKIKWLTPEELFDLIYDQLTEDSKRCFIKRGEGYKTVFNQPHNSIHRLTQTTGEGQFSPFVQPVDVYMPEMELVVFVLINEEATDIRRVCLALERIGNQGFGKDASIGLGKFILGEEEEIKIPEPEGANAYYTLAPMVPEPEIYSTIFASSFTRFGKHGDRLAVSRNPYKNPIIMADEGAVLIPKRYESSQKPYLGRGIKNLSIVEPETIAQGYCPYIPIKLENWS